MSLKTLLILIVVVHNDLKYSSGLQLVHLTKPHLISPVSGASSEVNSTTRATPQDVQDQSLPEVEKHRKHSSPIGRVQESTLRDFRDNGFKYQSSKNHSNYYTSVQVKTTPNTGKYKDNTKSNYGESNLKEESRFSNNLKCNITVNGSDTLVDCQYKFLENISSQMFPQNATVLLLDHNEITHVKNNTFQHLTSLLYLSLSNNQIKSLEPNAFMGLQNLRYLSLEMNDLNYTSESFPDNIFTPLDHLQELLLLQSKMYVSGTYPDIFLGCLSELQTLTIDSVGGMLTFGTDFARLTKLSSLSISGNVQCINDYSFENVATIKELYVFYLSNGNNISINAFSPLKNLKSLTLRHIEIGLNYTLSLLHTFVGRNMTKILLDEISLSVSQQDRTLLSHDVSLTAQNTKILLGICVKSFSLIDSNIFVVESSAFDNSSLWDSCLESIDLSHNPLTGSFLAFSRILRFKNLITFNATDVYQNCFNSGDFNKKFLIKQFPRITQNFIVPNIFLSQDPGVRSKMDYVALGNETLKVDQRGDENYPVTKEPNANLLDTHKSDSGPVIYAYISKSLKELFVKRFIASSPLNTHLVIVNGENVELIDMSNSGFHEFTGVIHGLTNLKTLLLSGNDMSLTLEKFFDTFPTLETLGMSTCKLDGHFIASKGRRLISKLVDLKNFSLSLNYLYILPKDIFTFNKNLEQLDLAGNNFKDIPFDLKTTPKLTKLDLRYNSLTSLDGQTTKELDNLVQRMGNFELSLEGNVLSCGCESIAFLQWMRMTHVNFDNNKNFTCINRDGDLSYTAHHTDLLELWRLCWGEIFLAVAVIFLCITVIGFLTAFLFIKNKTLVLSILLQFIWGFELKKRSDYETGVYIGYSDGDYHFPCLSLRVYLEKTLKLSTYLEDRDLLPSVDKASAITEAIHSCWRVVLVINQKFLYRDDWALFTLKSAIHSQSPSNPARLVVIVEDTVHHCLPKDLLSVVSEENIFVVTDCILNRELKDWLKLRLYF